ncbi:MAG TPA: LysE family transporter [Chitinophagales bacterium]|nr:LysE family transporter [Chitinophagales bacterium]
MIAIAIILGFIGYLPPGNINLAVVQLALTEGKLKLWSFIFFVAVMEMLYCIACIIGMGYLLKQPGLVRVAEWLAVVLFGALGIFTLLENRHLATGKTAPTGVGKAIFVTILNPLQIPFWMVWGVYVVQNHIIDGGLLSVTLFGGLTALGTIVVLWMYATGGKALVEKLNLNRVLLNRVIGILLLALALWELFKVLFS